MKVTTAMEMGRDSILAVLEELRVHTTEHWNEMIADVEEHGESDIEQRAINCINSANFEDPKSHRLASILCIVRYLDKFASAQGDELMFKVSVRQLVGEGENLSELLDKVMPTLIASQKTKRKDIW